MNKYKQFSALTKDSIRLKIALTGLLFQLILVMATIAGNYMSLKLKA